MAQVTQQGRSLLPFTKRSKEEVVSSLKQDAAAWQGFIRLSEVLQEELLGFAAGDRGLKISYDPFFKKIFDPEVHRERLSRMLSQILGFDVQVKRALPNDSQRIAADGSLLSMDVLAELESGQLANVEIQKIGYTFPGERAACYSSDLMMRQYTRVKEQKKDAFSYRDIQNVYTIVLIEKSTSEFHEIPQSYIHRSRDGFDTDLKLNLPQKFIFIPLDVFSKITYTVDRSMERELVAWLLFLSSDRLDDIVRIIDAYPFFAELYEEMAEFQRKPEELIGMYSEALAIMDRNTVRYMIEEQKKENEEQKRENERLRLEGEELRVKNERQRQENERQCQENERQRQENERQCQENERQRQENERQRQESERQRQESEQQCQAQKREIEQLRQLLNQKA